MKVKRTVADLDVRIERTRKNLAAADLERADAAIKAAEAQRTIADAIKQAELASRKEQEVREAKTVQLRLPLARHTFKRQVGVFLSDGRMRMPRRYSSQGIPTGVNRAVVNPDAPEGRVTPDDLQPNAGFAIVNTAECRARVMDELRQFDKGVCYIIFAVWPDSYAQFRVLRDVIVQEGFDYQLLLLGDGDPVVYGPGGSSEGQ